MSDAQARVERVAQAIAEEVDRDHHQRDHGARKINQAVTDATASERTEIVTVNGSAMNPAVPYPGIQRRSSMLIKEFSLSLCQPGRGQFRLGPGVQGRSPCV